MNDSWNFSKVSKKFQKFQPNWIKNKYVLEKSEDPVVSKPIKNFMGGSTVKNSQKSGSCLNNIVNSPKNSVILAQNNNNYWKASKTHTVMNQTNLGSNEMINQKIICWIPITARPKRKIKKMKKTIIYKRPILWRPSDYSRDIMTVRRFKLMDIATKCDDKGDTSRVRYE